MIEQRRFLGLDVGGTDIKAGILDSAGGYQRGESRATWLKQGKSGFLDALAEQAEAYGEVHGIGLGVPGVFQTGTGILQRSNNLRMLEGADLIAGLAQRLGRAPDSIRIGNDANMAAFGEQGFGGGRGQDDLLLVTLGTGVGGGVVLGGKLVTGPGGKAGEVGHLMIQPKALGGKPCTCGSFGCLETMTSATSALARAREAKLDGSLEEICERARSAPGPERDLMHAIGRDLGSGLSLAVSLLDINLFLVGGGFGAALDLLRPGALETLAERSYGNDPARLQPAELGNDAGWIGAARMASLG